jgi:hypothetical protein
MPHEERMVQNNSNAPGYQTLVEEGGTAYIGVNHIYLPHNPPNSRILELQLGAVSAELERLSSEKSEEIDVKLEEIREFERKGLGQSARNQIQNLRNSKNWEIFTKPLQAKILRMLARYAVTLDRDPSTAKNLLESSVQLDCESDTTFLRTLIRFYTDGMESALAEINNITDLSVLNLKLALLLEMDRADEAIDIVKSIPKNIQPNADTHRLHALALLTQGNVLEARQKIQEAITVSPEWQTVREAEALIDYHSALSPAALKKGRFPISEPVHRAFIKHDDESLNRLRKAEATFEQLASETESADELRQYWRIWQLACCASNPNRKNEAKVFCKTLLKENPGNTKALGWAIYRNYEIDAELSRKILEESLENSIDDINKIERITLLVWFYIDSSNSQTALSFLEENKEKFEQQDAIEYWLFWRIQALVGNEKFEIALRELETIHIPRVRHLLKTLVLQEMANKSGDWQVVIQHLENCFEETQDGEYLYDCCYLKSNLQDWDYVADRAEILLEKIETLGALNLALDCAYRAKRSNQCVKILNDNQNLFAKGVLPENLRYLRIWCLAQVGSITVAVTEITALVQEYPTPNNLALQMAVQFRQGDLDSMVLTARRLLNQDFVPTINLLQAARLVQPKSPRLACKLWEAAVAVQPVDPEILGEVIDIGFKLSLDTKDAKLRPFLYQAQVLALEDKGPFTAVSIKDVISLQNNRTEHTSELFQKYDRGELPIHLITETVGFPLINVFQNILEENAIAPKPHCQPPIFIRHGSRQLQAHPLPKELKSACTRWQLHLDISAFLMADYLKILQVLEDHFKPLKISASFQPALLHQLQRIQSHQPSQLELYRQLLELVRKGVLKELPRQLDLPNTCDRDLLEKMGQQWVSLLEKAKIDRGYIVDFLPLQRLDNEDELHNLILTEEDRERTIDCRSLIEALKQNNLLTDSQYRNTVGELESQGYSNISSSLPQIGASIFLIDGIASVLTQAKILNKICQHFRVFITYQYLDRARLAIRVNEQHSEITTRLTELIERVRDGLERNIYETVTFSDKSNLDLEFDRENNLNLLTAFDLFGFESQLNDDNIDLIWIDDRCLNQFLHRDGIQIITIIEILDGLLALDALSQDEYYEKLLQLRKANARYIPISGKEIIYWLKQAQIVDEAVKETEALAVLRQYTASCLLDSHRLQLPPLPEDALNPHGEIYFPLGCLSAASDAIVAGWLDDSTSNDNAIVYANWILVNLYTGTFGTRHLTPANHSNSNSNDWIALDISGLYIRGFLLCQETNQNSLEEQNRRQHYFEWINCQFTQRQFKANPEAVMTTAKAIHLFLTQERNTSCEDKLQDLCIRHIYRQFYYDLPSTLITAINADLDFMNWMGIKIVSSIQVNSIHFPAIEFWQAAEIAVNGRESVITAFKPEIRFKIQPVVNKSSGDIVEIRHLWFSDTPLIWLLLRKINSIAGIIFLRKSLKSNNGSLVNVINDASFQLLSKKRSRRENFLRSHSFWIDCESKTLRRVIGEIVSMTAPSERIEKAHAWRERSAAFFYKKLKMQLDRPQKLNISELIPPSAVGLVQYFRLETTISSSDDFHKHLNQAARSLIADEGIEEALERLSCLPVKLPPIVSEVLSKLKPEHRRALLKKLADSWKSPICKFHLIDLALESPQEEEIDLVKRLLDEIYSDEESNHLHLFELLLQLVSNEFGFRDDVREWSVPIRLAMTWAHASKLHNLLDISGLKLPDFIDELCGIVTGQINPDYLNWNSAFWNDVLSPHRFDPTILLVHGLASLLQEKSSDVLNQVEVIDKLKQVSIKTVDGQLFPHIPLFRDPLLAEDSLRSILGGNSEQLLSQVFGTEVTLHSEFISRENTITNAVEQLSKDPNNIESWHWINTIVGSLPIYNSLTILFKQVIEKIDLPTLFEINHEAGLIASNIVCSQVKYIGNDKTRLYLENQVLLVIELLSKREKIDDTDAENLAYQLMTIIFKLSTEPGNPSKTSQNTTDLMIRAINIWKEMANSNTYFNLLGIIQKLPTEQIHGFYKLFLHFRALRSQSDR